MRYAASTVYQLRFSNDSVFLSIGLSPARAFCRFSTSRKNNNFALSTAHYFWLFVTSKMFLAKTTCELRLVFPPGKSGGEISRKIWGFEISRFPENFLYIIKDFSGNDTHHSDITNALMQILIFFLL